LRPTHTLAALLFVTVTPARTEIIDRIAVSVGKSVITASDIERQIRVSAFLDAVKPDLSPTNRKAIADRMVEQKLVRRELETSRFPVPGASEVEPILEKFQKEHYPNPGDMARGLAEYGITEQDLLDDLLWQRTLLQFIEVRFRPGIQISNEEIQTYFDQVVSPAARAAHPGQPVALEDFRNQIETTLAGQRVDRELDTWLKEARRHTDIAYHEEAFQ
jgi:peptidyl-prolyl cis-trans isomerase SurA